MIFRYRIIGSEYAFNRFFEDNGYAKYLDVYLRSSLVQVRSSEILQVTKKCFCLLLLFS